MARIALLLVAGVGAILVQSAQDVPSSRIPFGIDLPYWVNDEALDFHEHVHRAALPAPGNMQELADLTGHLFSIPLDRSRRL